ncbi:hypothetical protein NPX13_g8018 [Xylaria arbuscula]|uniref:Uncharacterized protein n=1 Tax=Xylaria arbuscula TaxID=114810 RepID=A0A9W8N9G2_9PEZI|nr:hypothetical protein NPX13_g8018 [Xylaria arbuscula]
MGLRHFERDTVENAVQKLVDEAYNDEQLRARLGIQGSVTFESHTNLGDTVDAVSHSIEQMLEKFEYAYTAGIQRIMEKGGDTFEEMQKLKEELAEELDELKRCRELVRFASTQLARFQIHSRTQDIDDIADDKSCRKHRDTEGRFHCPRWGCDFKATKPNHLLKHYGRYIPLYNEPPCDNPISSVGDEIVDALVLKGSAVILVIVKLAVPVRSKLALVA